MLFKLRKLFVVFLFLSFSTFTQAAPPSLSINPEEYNYDLSITAVLVENCQELKNPNNLLVAYINGKLSGYATSSTVVGNRLMAFLTVYSNKPAGDTIKFQIYNADRDVLIPVKTTLVFEDDAIYGNPSLPQEMHTNNRPVNLQLSKLLVPENQPANPNLATISATDIDKDNTLAYSLVPGLNSTDNASFKVVGNQLQFNGKVNTATQDTFKIRIQVADNFGCTLEKAFSLVVDRVNDAPTGLKLSDSTFFENVAFPVVGIFSAADPDLIDSFRYSFTAGAGDVDNAKFSISDSSLVFKNSANFEVKNSYSIRCRVTDIGGLFFDKTFTIYVKDKNDPPTSIVLSSTKVFENEPANKFVAKIRSIDEDVVDKYEYTFANIGTNDNFSFTIQNDTLRANKVFDFETRNTYIIYLTSTDSSGTFTTKPFTINIQDTLDAPTDLMMSNTNILENAPKGTFVGKLSTVDAKSAGTFTYTFTLVTGNGSTDNKRFYISKDSVYSNEVFNYEANKKFSIRVKATLVNGLFIEKDFLITVEDIFATSITLSGNKAFENEPINQFIAKISTVSKDLEKRYEYTFGNIGTNDNASFTISNDTLRANKLFDFETKSSYIIYLTSTDSSKVSINKLFTITVNDALDVPTDILLTNATVVENNPKKTFIGVLSTVDANFPGPNVYVYTLVSGKGSENNSSFIISNDSLYTAQVFDFEKKTSYTIRTRTTLINGMYTEKEFTILVIDVVSTNITLNNNRVFENEPSTQFVAKISTISKDTSDAYQYTFGNIGTNDNTSFTIENDTLKANKVFDYETKNSYNVILISTSLSGLSITKSFTIFIRDSLDVPTDLHIDNSIIVESQARSTFIGKLSTVDANTPPVKYSYTTVSGSGSTDNNLFKISNDSLFSNEVFDFEKKTKHSTRIRSTLVNGMFVEKVIPISIQDIPSTDITLSNSKVYENEPLTQFVSKILTVSLDTSDSYRYSFGNVGTNDNSSFTIINDTLKANKVFDFETKDSYNIYLVSTSLSGLSITRQFKISIKDTLDVPVDMELDNISISENSPKPVFIGKLTTIDANTQPVKYTYTFVKGIGSADSSTFRISKDSLFSNEVFDFENRIDYNVRIRSTLVNKMYVEKAFAIKVLNVNETPKSLHISKDSIAENTNDSTFVCSFSTIDEDKGDRFAYSLVSGTNDTYNKEFVIKNGTLILVRPANFEKTSVYKIRVRTTDAGGLFLDSTFSIHIKDVNEQPFIINQTYEILELAPQQTEIGNVVVREIDKNQIHKFEILTPDVPFSVNTNTGMIALSGAIDYERKKIYDILFKITDSGFPALSDSVSMRIVVLDEIEDDVLPSADLVSPNGDGRNDTWKITNVELYKDYSLHIVDEYSQLVFSVGSNYSNEWDARLNGAALPSGVYYYVFKNNNNGKLYKGYITVVK